MLGLGTSTSIVSLGAFLPTELLDEMKDYVADPTTVWIDSDKTSHPGNGLEQLTTLPGVDDQGQRTSVLLLRGKPKTTLPRFVQGLQSVLSEELGAAQLQRIKFNVLASRDVSPASFNTPHWDSTDPYDWSMVVYLKGTTGDTVFFDQTYQQFIQTRELTIAKRHPPTAGTSVVFPSRLVHASASPWDGQDRIVANITFSVV